MDVKSHPKELTKENINIWLESFVKNLKRSTSRNDLDRLILSVERIEFRHKPCAGWTEVIFQNGKGKVSGCKWDLEEEWVITSFQKKILDSNPDLEGRIIKRSELNEEKGEWLFDKPFSETIISAGGEAIVMEEKIGVKLDKVVVRVQAFDPALFTKEEDKLDFLINISQDYKIAVNKEIEEQKSIPYHENIVKNYSNIEIFSIDDENKEDCLGWITIMEKCDSCLRRRLRAEDLNLEERKKIAIGVKEGEKYLKNIGILHYDQKPDNILLKNGVPKWCDFGIVWDSTGKKSYREMGYVRKGTKYRSYEYFYSGSAGFSGTRQLSSEGGGYERRILIFILCDWKTAWSLLFNPIDPAEKDKIRNELKAFKADWLFDKSVTKINGIQKLSKIITLNKASSHLCLDDPNLTKSIGMGNLKQQMTRQMNFDFRNITKNVLDQKETNLCVPISISVLLRWAIKNDLKIPDSVMNDNFTLEQIFIKLSMIIYPRSMAGLNLNPQKGEQGFQHNEIKMLLERLKFETYLNRSGWEIIANAGNFKNIRKPNKFWHKTHKLDASFNYEQVLLHNDFIFHRPLTVTAAYLNPDGSVSFHQMTLDRVENDQYILQNSLLSHCSSQLRIFVQNRYYADLLTMKECQKLFGDYVYRGPYGEFLHLANEQCNNMYPGEWYLLPQAFSITLTPQ